MDETIVTGTAATEFEEAIDLHGSDRRFWNFVAAFAATVRHDITSADGAKTVRLITECARQYAYLREEHPEHFERLRSEPGDVMKLMVAVADVAIVTGLPERHFAGSGLLEIAFKGRKEFHEQQAAEERRKREQIARFEAETAELERNPPQVSVPFDGFAVESRHHTTEELADLAHGFYAQSKGRLVKVYRHIPDGGDDLGYTRTSKVFRNYDIALVDEGGEDFVGVTAPQGKVAESSWPVVMMTGANRGKKASIAALDFNADGSVLANDLVLVTLPGFILRERLQDSELVELVRLDMHDYAERPIDVTAASVYFAGTDDQDFISFDPPLPGVVDPFDDELRDFKSMYRIDDWSQRDGISVIDVYLDFESTDERADKYRSMWTHGVSYTSHGVVEVGETPALPFIPEFVARKKSRDAEDVQALGR